MPLPELIEIIPVPAAVQVAVTVPGSKSITNRALILAALAEGTTRLEGALWSEDTQVMTDCLTRLGVAIDVKADAAEPCNRNIVVHGVGGKLRSGGTASKPLELFVGNAGTAARFLAALVCLGQGVYRLYGVPRMHERPQAALLSALRALGYRIESQDDRLPAVIHGTGSKPGHCTVSIEESSQFASALLLCAHAGSWQVDVKGENAEESPYIAMTSQLISQFPASGHNSGRAADFSVEPDASSASYFWGAGWLLGQKASGPSVRVAGWNRMSHWQIDAEFPKYLPLPASISRQSELGDSIMTGMVLAPFANHPVRFTNLGRLRVQECERVHAMRTELSRCGARVIETGDTLEVFPTELHGATVETYNDHRVAMCFAILGLKVAGIKIKNPACVKKTFPNFFQKLAAPPPHGLGATVFDPVEVTPLDPTELIAE